MATPRNVLIRYTKDGDWPKGAEVIVREDNVPKEAAIVSYETGEVYPESTADAKPSKPTKQD